MKVSALCGQRISHLVVTGFAWKDALGIPYYACKCDCGGTVVRRLTSLLNAKKRGSISGCASCQHAIRSSLKVKHGDNKRDGASKLYMVWGGIKRRCLNPRQKSYRHYGAKGVRICDEWLDYEEFRSWAIQSGYRQGLCIDRIDPKGNYQPSNCRWITKSDNSKRARGVIP